MPLIYLGKLQKGRFKDPVCVRVMRKWTFKENMGSGQPLYVGLVLADARGDAIYAEIPQESIQTMEHLIEVGNTYNISKFRIVNAKPTYKPFDAQLMMEFTDFTSIIVATNVPKTFPAYVYSLTPFESIAAATGSIKKFTDVIGYIKSYKAAVTKVPRGKERATILREVFINDIRDNTLKVTLWSEFATNFNIDHVYNEEVGNVVVVLFVGCMPREIFSKLFYSYKCIIYCVFCYTYVPIFPERTNPISFSKLTDTTYLSGGTAFAYYLNPNIPEAQPFYSRFKDETVFIERPQPSEEHPSTQIQITPLQQKTLAELNSIDPFEFADEGYKCTVTITEVIVDNNWWYMSCKSCKKKTDPQPGGGYICPKCLGTATTPRYMLSFAAKDETAEVMFFAYDDIARQIIQKECAAILNPLKMTTGLPQQLSSIVSKKFIFSIGLTEDSFSKRAKRKYLINSILDRSDRRTSELNILDHQDTTQKNPPNLVAAPVCATLPETIRDTHVQPQTPAPLPDTDETPDTDRTARPLRTQTATRRKLFDEGAGTDQTDVDTHDDDQDSQEQFKHQHSKRAKQTPSKESTKDVGHTATLTRGRN